MPILPLAPRTGNPTTDTIGKLIDDADNVVFADALSIAWHLSVNDINAARNFLITLNHNFETCFPKEG